jgi:hypothetical protein
MLLFLWSELGVATATTTSLNNTGVGRCFLDSTIPVLLHLSLVGRGGEVRDCIKYKRDLAEGKVTNNNEQKGENGVAMTENVNKVKTI